MNTNHVDSGHQAANGTAGPYNTDRYHGMNATQLQSEIYKLDTLNRQLLAALREIQTRSKFADRVWIAERAEEAIELADGQRVDLHASHGPVWRLMCSWKCQSQIAYVRAVNLEHAIGYARQLYPDMVECRHYPAEGQA